MKWFTPFLAMLLLVVNARSCFAPPEPGDPDYWTVPNQEQPAAGSWAPWPSSHKGSDNRDSTGQGGNTLPNPLTSTETPTTGESLPAPIATKQQVEIFKVMNGYLVYNGARAPELTLPLQGPAECTATKILTYHWNDGSGMTPGTIALQGSDGSYYGPYQASGEDGMGGVLNANWVVFVEIPIVQQVTYTVIDSDPGTWSQNSDTGGEGMTIVWGVCGQ